MPSKKRPVTSIKEPTLFEMGKLEEAGTLVNSLNVEKTLTLSVPAAERALGVLKCGQTAVRPDLRADWEMLIFLSVRNRVAGITAKNFIPNRKNRTQAKFQAGELR